MSNLVSKQSKLNFIMGSANNLLSKVHIAMASETMGLPEFQRTNSMEQAETEVREALSEVVRSVNYMYGGYVGLLNKEGKLARDCDKLSEGSGGEKKC